MSEPTATRAPLPSISAAEHDSIHHADDGHLACDYCPGGPGLVRERWRFVGREMYYGRPVLVYACRRAGQYEPDWAWLPVSAVARKRRVPAWAPEQSTIHQLVIERRQS